MTTYPRFDPPPGWDDLAADVTRLCGLLGKPHAVREYLSLAQQADRPEAQVEALKASVELLGRKADATADRQEQFALAGQDAGKGKGK